LNEDLSMQNISAEVDFDIDVDQMIMFESPKKTDDPAEPTRPKRNSQKDRRNSLYEYCNNCS
jgi:hypothetical protein